MKKKVTFVPNLKGVIVGNGVTVFSFDNAVAYIEMALWYGLNSTETYNGLKEFCINGNPSSEIC